MTARPHCHGWLREDFVCLRPNCHAMPSCVAEFDQKRQRPSQIRRVVHDLQRKDRGVGRGVTARQRAATAAREKGAHDAD